MKYKNIMTLVAIILGFLIGTCVYKLDTRKSIPPIKQEKHEHKPGQFGGLIIELGRDNYHLEVVTKGSFVTIYILDKDESKILVIEKQILDAYIKDEQFAIMPKPQVGDGDGTSRFECKIPSKFLDEEINIITFNIVIKGDRFRVKIPVHNPQITDEEKELYLTPGGIYTDQDIIANNGMTVSQKFKNFVPHHDLEPKKGDRICPITLTKANPRCSWVINGKEYWFCCPPCIEEFVKLAKEKPEKIKSPEEYVK